MARFNLPGPKGDAGVSGAGALTRWTPSFSATGLTFTGTGSTHPAYKSYYAKNGSVVSFWIEIDMTTVTNFGTGQFKSELPFMPISGSLNHFAGWVNVDPSQNPDLAGHIILNVDHLANTKELDFHYLKQAGGAKTAIVEAMLVQNTPVVFTTATIMYVNGTYLTSE